MCGIAGLLDTRRSTAADALHALATGMAATMVHRGPDDDGAWADAEAGIGLSFRRLAIVDLTPTGKQPMVSHDGRYVLVFNGEVYNHRALRAELEAAGVVFRGTSDTEVLLEAISAWGPETALERANAMFGFACWDRRERRLHLARDRFGEKPLYYGWAGDTLVFGSELKALHAHPGFAPAIDRDALALYFRYAYVPAPRSIYAGVAKVPPATILTFDAARPRAEPVRVEFWSAIDVALADSDRRDGPDSRDVDTIEDALRDSVALRMVADVPVGAFLSGGTDSSLVVALMQAQSALPVRTFTIGFDVVGYDEAARAKAVAAHLGTDHTELYLTEAQTRAVIPSLPSVYDEPFADSSQIPTLLVSELARREVTVSLSGDGGDELFGGYTRYLALTRLQRLSHLPVALRAPVAALLQSQPPERWDRVVRSTARVLPGRGAPAQPGDKLHKLARALRTDESAHLYRSLVECWDQSIVRDAHEPGTVVDPPARWPLPAPEWAMLADTVTYLPDDLLVKVDRASMAHSLEARVPMLDPVVYERAWRLPLEAKLGRGQGKRVLHDILRRHLPEPLVGGPKTGFGVPFGEWLRGPLREWADDLLAPARLRSEGYLDAAAVQQSWSDHRSGTRDHRHQLWAVLMFEAWLTAGAGVRGGSSS